MPRLGIGLPLSASQTQASVLVIDDPLFESFGGLDIAVNYTATRTNLTLYAQDTTQSQWVKTSTGIEGTLYEDPDGGTTGNAITGAASNSTKFIHQVQSVTAGETYTYSAYIKKAALGFAILEVSDGTTTYSGNFNLTGGAVATTTRLITSAIDDRSNGWYRCSITFQALNSSEGGQIRAYATLADNTPTVNVAVADTVLIYIWGQQFEADGEPTDYIVTTTEARTATTLLNDLSKTWDFDSNDIMPEADPDAEGSWETFPNVVLNGNYEELGSELVTNGDFSTETDWTFANVGFSAGAIAFDDSNDSVFQNLADTVGKTYKLIITKTGAGVFRLRTGFSGSDATKVNIPESGVVYFTATSNTNRVQIYGDASDASSTLNSVSVKQVDPNDRWSLQTGWSISDGKAHVDTSSTVFISQSFTNLGAGNTYEITLTMSNFTAGALQPQFGGILSSPAQVNSNGTHTVKITATSSSHSLLLYAIGTSKFSIDNVTIKEYAIQPQDV